MGYRTINTHINCYDKLGRLIAADFKQPSVNNPQATTLADYSTAYTYDLQGNILTLKRKGPTSSKLYGVVDDITATYQGNQIASLRDDASNVLLEASLDLPNGSWNGSDFAYDRNGNQTRDLSRGVADIVYNELNLPARVEMDGGGSIEYLYTAAGTKLAEIVRDEDNQIINRRDYAGMFEYEADSIVRIALASGYVTVADTVYHIYTPDYQGNIVAVYNTATGQQEHYKDHYPYGLPHAEMPKSSSITPGFPGLNPGLGSGLGPIITIPTNPEPTKASTNRRWYGAKELTTDHGLNTFDFEARILAPAFPRFTTPDPLAHFNFQKSIYCFCGSDPINFIDPSGMDEFCLDSCGNVMSIVENTEYDQIHIVDSNGDRTSSSEKYEYGTIKLQKDKNGTDEQQKKIVYDLYSLSNDVNAKKIFEWVARQTTVEWSQCNLVMNDDSDKFLMTTTHKENREAGMGCELFDVLKIGTSESLVAVFLSHLHSHPAETPYPSGLPDFNNESRPISGDIKFATSISEIFKDQAIYFKIYLPKSNQYVPYGKDSSYSDYHYNIVKK